MLRLTDASSQSIESQLHALILLFSYGFERRSIDWICDTGFEGSAANCFLGREQINVLQHHYRYEHIMKMMNMMNMMNIISTASRDGRFFRYFN